MTDAIARFYDRFPYPRVASIQPPASARHTLGVLSYLARRRAPDALPSAPRVWVAGCGTQQGSTWGCALPDADVLATDVSERALDDARSVASRLSLTNVRFERGDLREGPPAGRFDLIVCTGVVHHLEDPAVGVRALAEALAPNGVLLFMVYSAAHRGAFAPLRAAARRLAEGAGDPMEVAREVLAAALSAPDPPARAILEVLRARIDDDPAFVADVLLNPIEHHYDVASLHALVEGAGLRVQDWQRPAAWRRASRIGSPRLRAMASRLDPIAKAQLAIELAPLASPLLEVVVERADAPARAAYSRDERLTMPLVLAGGARAIELDVDGPPRERFVPPYETRGDTIGGATSAGDWNVSAALLPLLDACDGTRPLGELLDAHAALGPREAILGALQSLLPHDVALLAPAW